MTIALSITRTLIAAASGAFLGAGIGLALTLIVALISLIAGTFPSIKHLAITGAWISVAPVLVISCLASYREIKTIRAFNAKHPFSSDS